VYDRPEPAAWMSGSGRNPGPAEAAPASKSAESAKLLYINPRIFHALVVLSTKCGISVVRNDGFLRRPAGLRRGSVLRRPPNWAANVTQPAEASGDRFGRLSMRKAVAAAATPAFIRPALVQYERQVAFCPRVSVCRSGRGDYLPMLRHSRERNYPTLLTKSDSAPLVTGTDCHRARRLLPLGKSGGSLSTRPGESERCGGPQSATWQK
jgi:hypothetical protein